VPPTEYVKVVCTTTGWVQLGVEESRLAITPMLRRTPELNGKEAEDLTAMLVAESNEVTG
jgi:hypothetical protein